MSTLGNNLFAAYYAQNQYDPIIRDGLVLYMPLDTHHEHAYTGQLLSYLNGDISVYEKYKGVPCRTIPSSTVQYRIEIADMALPVGSEPRTCSFWYCRTSIESGATLGGYGLFNSYQRWSMCEQTNTINLVLTQPINPNPLFLPLKDEWVFLSFVYNDSKCFIYKDGVKMGTGTDIQLNTQPSIFNIMGSSPLISNYRMSSVRLYNRALSQNEITLLAHEFTPMP